jgi:dTDP-4-dehydrorhamnose reductase
MNDETVLVFGGSGLVGSYLLPQLASLYKSLYVSSHFTTPSSGEQIRIDLSSPELVTEILHKTRPSVIVNLAAYTDVDSCERNKDYAYQLNARLPGIVSDYLKTNQKQERPCYFLHISTDYVFDGLTGNYVENAKPNPINWYGRTKLCGEQEIINRLNCEMWCIARISTPFGIHPVKQSFPVYIINKIREHQTVRVVTDQFTSPTYSKDLAMMFIEIIQRKINGIVHTACQSRLSRYDQAIKIAKEFKLNKNMIVQSSSGTMNWLAARPKDSSLNVNKATKLLNNGPKTYDESLKSFVLEYSEKS